MQPPGTREPVTAPENDDPSPEPEQPLNPFEPVSAGGGASGDGGGGAAGLLLLLCGALRSMRRRVALPLDR